MNWIMEIATPTGWSAVKPTGGEPYTFATPEEAAKMLRMCYPDQVREDRLDKVTKQARIRNTLTEETLAGWAA